jgi:hypothetical protein
MSTLKLSTISNTNGTQTTDVLNVINGSAKAWVNFNGTGTVAIRAAYNVSFITDNGSGDYTIVFTTAMPDANYAAIGMAEYTSGAAVNITAQSGGYAAGSIQVFTHNDAGGASRDSATVTVSIFR